VHTSYRIGKQLQVYGLIQNIFDQRYYTSGALFDVTSFPNSAPFLTNPASLGPGKPFAIYGGLRLTL
jgi:iron complex outermembrane receptor protein